LIRQPLNQIAKTEGTIYEVAANLAVEEHHAQGEGQNPDHGEHDQGLAAHFLSWTKGSRRSSFVLVIGLREDAIDGIDEL